MKSLDGQAMNMHKFLGNRVTVLSVSFQAHGRQQLMPFHDAILEAFRPSNSEIDYEHPQLLDLVYMEGFVYRLFESWLTSGTKQACRPEMLPFTAIKCEGNPDASEVSTVRLRPDTFMIKRTGIHRQVALSQQIDGICVSH